MDLMNIIVIFCVILISMTLHEAMHAFAGYWQGDDTAKDEGRLTLNPIRHIDPFMTILLPLMLALAGMPIFGGAKPVPFNPNQLRNGEFSMAIVALAGPFTNLAIAFILYGILALFNTGSSMITYIMEVGVYINLGFFVFNMIPIPPLDGSRALYVLAPDFVKRAMEAVESYGMIFVFILVIVASYSGLLGGIMSGSIDAVLGLFRVVFGS